ncbi:hypothetical protein RUM44_005694 [Polyplax serrata]|uniref:PDZ domain-containing protein n=1 Tax=Polyplax serrata TaxID=468196 RepID=A0ABR1AWA1_POLSC
MASYQSGSSLEVCYGHKREQSQDSGAYIDWNSEDSSSPVSNPDSAATDDFITVVAVENGGNGGEKANDGKKDEASFVTILAIGDTEGKSQNSDVEEEVLVYRLPGERLGFGLKFEGGTNTAENVKRLFIQSSVPDSPASRAKCSWGSLVEGDEIIKIDGNVVKTMTRLDCVRCLKESSVVIKLYVRHRENKTIQQSNRVKLENHNEVRTGNALSSSSSSPTVVSAEMKKNVPPPPPPVPPRKIARKSPPSTFPKESLEGSGDLQNPTPKTRTIQNGCEDTSKNSSKHIIRVPQKGGQDSPEMTKHSLKRNGSDHKIAPPEPKVYLDLLAQEESRNCESESDDTCSTVSTVVGLSSVPTTTNSSFSDLRSSASSFCDSTNPSTPTSEPTTPVLELSKVLSPFEHSQNNEFLFSKLINYKDQDGVNYDEKTSTCSDDIAPLQPPLSFQDAPLSYGNEDMLTNMSENLRIYNDENSGNSIKNLTDEVTSTEYDSSGDGKFKDKNQNLTKKPSLIPRLAKTIGLLSPPKPSPRKESKGDGSKSRFNKKKPPPPPFPVSSQNGIVEQTENKIKSSIPYLKKKKNKHTGKAEKKSKYPEDATPKVEISLPIELQMQQPNDLVIENQDEGDGNDRNVPEMPKTPESDKKLTWEVPDLKNLTDNKVNGKPETGDQKHDVPEVESEKFLSETKSECDNDAVDETSDSHFVFPWSKHLETIGEDEEDSTVEETFTDGCVENIKKDVPLPEPEIKTEQKRAEEELDAEGEANEEETEKTADKFGKSLSFWRFTFLGFALHNDI